MKCCVMGLLAERLASISRARINMQGDFSMFAQSLKFISWITPLRLSNRLWMGLALLILAVVPSWSFGQAETPCLFSPSGAGTDDSQALAALLRTCRWVQID